MFGISLGRSPWSLLDEDLRLVYNELTAGARLYTPSGLRLVAGAAIHQVSREVTSAGVPRSIILCDDGGSFRGFWFEDGSSTALVKAGSADYAAESVTMLDANGWATVESPSVYEYSDPKGRLFRFGADPSDPETYLQLVSVRFPGGRTETDDDIGFEILRDAEGTPRQIVGPAKIAILPDAPAGEVGYDIVLYPNDASTTSWQRDAVGFYVLDPGAEPLVTWRVRNPDPETELMVDLSKVVGDSSPVTWRFVYNTELEDFSLEYPDEAMKSFSGMYYNEDRSSVVVEKYNVINGERTSHKLSEFHRYGDTYRRVAKTRDPDGLALRSEYAYYDDATRNGLEKSVVYEDGSWERFDYDASRRLSKKVSPWLDSDLDDPDEESVCTTYDYAPFLASDVVRWNDTRPRVETTRTTGIETSRFYYAYPTNGAGRSLSIKEQAGAQGAPFGDPRNRRWTTEFYGPADGAFLHGRVAVETDFTGWTAAHTYERGFVNLATCAFVPDPGGDAWRETVIKTKPGAMTRRLRSVKTSQGCEVLSTEEGLHESGEWIPLATVKMAYDRNGNLIRKETQDGRIEEWSYGLNCCGMESHTTWDGQQFVYVYDNFGNLLSETQKGIRPDGSDDVTTSFSRRPDGLLLSAFLTNSVAKLGISPIVYTYDAADRIATVKNSRGGILEYSNGEHCSSTKQGPDTNTVYRYLDGRVSSTKQNSKTQVSFEYGITPSGTTWTIQRRYPEITHQWEKSSYDYFGRMESVTQTVDENSFMKLSFSYDDNNCVAGKTLLSYPEGMNEDGHIVRRELYQNDSEGRRLTVCLDVNSNGRIDYAGLDRIVEKWYGYTKLGSRWFATTRLLSYPLSNNATSRLDECIYTALSGAGNVVSEQIRKDVFGNVVTNSLSVFRTDAIVEESKKSPRSILPYEVVMRNGLLVCEQNSLALTNYYSYDALRRLSASTTSNGQQIVFTYNDAGDLSSQAIAGQIVTHYDHDEWGRVIHAIQPDGSEIFNRFDGRGRLKSKTGGISPLSYEHDEAGRIISVSALCLDPGGIETNLLSQWTYDLFSDNPVRQAFTDGSEATLRYQDGQLVETRLPDGETTFAEYLPSGEISTKSYSGETPTIHYEYLRDGRIASAICEGVSTNVYAYSFEGLLTNEVQNGIQIARCYDTCGRIVELKIGEAPSVQYAYDALGRLESVVTPIVDFSYVRDPDSHRVSEIVSDSGVIRRYGYDPLYDGIVVASNYVGGVLSSGFEYELDSKGRRTRKTWIDSFGAGYSAFSYNWKDEICEEILAGLVISNSFTPSGRRVTAQWTTDASGNSISQGSGTDSIFDGNGALSKIDDWYYCFDSAGRVSFATNSSWRIDWDYDHLGRTIRKTAMNTFNEKVSETEFFWDGFNIVLERVKGVTASTNFNVWGEDLGGGLQTAGGVGGLLCVIQDQNAAYPFHDGLGNIYEYVRSNGERIAAKRYSAFGDILVESLENHNMTHWFATKPYDNRTKLIEYEQRSYSPSAGSWLTRDPVALALHGIEYYSFCLNNPLSYADKLGLFNIDLDLTEVEAIITSGSGTIKLGECLEVDKQFLDKTASIELPFGNAKLEGNVSASITGKICKKCCDDGRAVTDLSAGVKGDVSLTLSASTLGDDGSTWFFDYEWWAGLKGEGTIGGGVEGSLFTDKCNNVNLGGKVCLSANGSLSISGGAHGAITDDGEQIAAVGGFVTGTVGAEIKKCFICAGGKCHSEPSTICYIGSVVAELELLWLSPHITIWERPAEKSCK